MSTVCEPVGLARSNIAERAKAPIGKRRPGRLAQPDEDMVTAIRMIMGQMPSYGYRRVWALLRRAAQSEGRPSSITKGAIGG